MRISLHPGAEHDVAEVEKLIQEAIAFHFAGLREDGLAIPHVTSRVEYVNVAARLRTPEESAL